MLLWTLNGLNQRTCALPVNIGELIVYKVCVCIVVLFLKLSLQSMLRVACGGVGSIQMGAMEENIPNLSQQQTNVKHGEIMDTHDAAPSGLL